MKQLGSGLIAVRNMYNVLYVDDNSTHFIEVSVILTSFPSQTINFYVFVYGVGRYNKNRTRNIAKKKL
jgi:hypothetical protein